jgi:hypothetical protein
MLFLNCGYVTFKVRVARGTIIGPSLGANWSKFPLRFPLKEIDLVAHQVKKSFTRNVSCSKRLFQPTDNPGQKAEHGDYVRVITKGRTTLYNFFCYIGDQLVAVYFSSKAQKMYSVTIVYSSAANQDLFLALQFDKKYLLHRLPCIQIAGVNQERRNCSSC